MATCLTFSPGHSFLTKYSDKTKCTGIHCIGIYDAYSSTYTVSLKGQKHFPSTQTKLSHKHRSTSTSI